MKRTHFFDVFALLLMLGSILVLWHCRSEKVGPTEPTEPTIIEPEKELYLQGRVIDSVTRQGIAGVEVTIVGISALTTNSEGYYKIEAITIPTGKIQITATTDGYAYGSTIASIDTSEKNAVVRTILLRPLNSPILIGTDGGTVEIQNNESVSGSVVSIEIPEGALDQTTGVSLTPLEGVDVPSLPPEGMLNLITVHLAPINLLLNKPTLLNLPLPLKGTPGDSLPLLSYNQSTNTWASSGQYAIIGMTGDIASTEIDNFGIYSLGVEGSYSEELEEEKEAEYVELDTTQNFDIISSLPTLEYPEGKPDSISAVWLKNTVSQNTQIEGRVSFYDSSYYNIFYAPNPPDTSLTLAKTVDLNSSLGTMGWVCRWQITRVRYCWYWIRIREIVTIRWYWRGRFVYYRIINVITIRRFCGIYYTWYLSCWYVEDHDQGAN